MVGWGYVVKQVQRTICWDGESVSKRLENGGAVLLLTQLKEPEREEWKCAVNKEQVLEGWRCTVTQMIRTGTGRMEVYRGTDP